MLQRFRAKNYWLMGVFSAQCLLFLCDLHLFQKSKAHLLRPRCSSHSNGYALGSRVLYEDFPHAKCLIFVYSHTQCIGNMIHQRKIILFRKLVPSSCCPNTKSAWILNCPWSLDFSSWVDWNLYGCRCKSLSKMRLRGL